MHDQIPGLHSSKPTKRLLRKPRQSRPARATTTALTLDNGVNDEPPPDSFLFVDAPLDYDFIHRDSDADAHAYPFDPLADEPMRVPEGGRHRCRRSDNELEKKYILESPFTMSTPHLVKPRVPRGPGNFPYRPLHRMTNLLHDLLWDDEDLAYCEVPAFTLNDFVQRVALYSETSVHAVQQTVFSRHNYKKLTRLLAEENAKTCDTVATVDFNEQREYTHLQ